MTKTINTNIYKTESPLQAMGTSKEYHLVCAEYVYSSNNFYLLIKLLESTLSVWYAEGKNLDSVPRPTIYSTAQLTDAIAYFGL